MEDMATGFALSPHENQTEGNFSFKDAEWMMMMIVAMFGGDEFKGAMMDAAMSKAKEVIERGKQLIPEPAAEKPAE